MNIRVTEVSALQEQLAPKNAALLQLYVKHVELTHESSCLKLQSATGDTVSKDPKLIAVECESPAKRVNLMHRCKDSSATLSFMALSALLAERDESKNRCEALNLQNQCILGLAAEAKELSEKVSKPKKTVVAAKTTPKRSEKKQQSAANRRVVAEVQQKTGLL